MNDKQSINNKDELVIIVDNIIKLGCDDEHAHSSEDALHLRLIMQFCPDWVKNEIERLNGAKFNRWCA